MCRNTKTKIENSLQNTEEDMDTLCHMMIVAFVCLFVVFVSYELLFICLLGLLHFFIFLSLVFVCFLHFFVCLSMCLLHWLHEWRKICEAWMSLITLKSSGATLVPWHWKSPAQPKVDVKSYKNTDFMFIPISSMSAAEMLLCQTIHMFVFQSL